MPMHVDGSCIDDDGQQQGKEKGWLNALHAAKLLIHVLLAFRGR